MEVILREFTVTDSYRDIATIRISQNSVVNLIGWIEKLNLINNTQITLWTYSWLKAEYLKSKNTGTKIETEMFDDDCCCYLQEGNLFRVTIPVLDRGEDFFWISFMFGFNDEANEQVIVDYESSICDNSLMEYFTGYRKPYKVSSWKSGMIEIQAVLEKAFPEIPFP